MKIYFEKKNMDLFEFVDLIKLNLKNFKLLKKYFQKLKFLHLDNFFVKFKHFRPIQDLKAPTRTSNGKEVSSYAIA